MLNVTLMPSFMSMPMCISMQTQVTDEMADLTNNLELELGRLVRKKYDSDFFMLDQYPSAVRYIEQADHSDHDDA